MPEGWMGLCLGLPLCPCPMHTSGPTAPCRAWSPSALPGSVLFHHLQHRGWCPGWLRAVPPALGGRGDVTAPLILLCHPRDGVRGLVRVTQSRRGTERAAVGTQPPPSTHPASSPLPAEQGDKGARGQAPRGAQPHRHPWGHPAVAPCPAACFCPLLCLQLSPSLAGSHGDAHVAIATGTDIPALGSKQPAKKISVVKCWGLLHPRGMLQGPPSCPTVGNGPRGASLGWGRSPRASGPRGMPTSGCPPRSSVGFFPLC